MPKPTQADLIDRLRAVAQIGDDDLALRHEAADALEALAEETMPLALIAKQAEDAGLWFQANTAAEAYLQQELRKLHAAIEALAAEGAEPTWDGNPDTAAEQAAEAGCAKPAGELPALPLGRSAGSLPERAIVYHADELRAYALRALRERA